MVDSQRSSKAFGVDLTLPAAPLDQNLRFGAYVVRERIGRGAMGSVYRAVHELLGKPVALKVMDPALRGDAAARQRFLREAQVAASIKHPNVVDIIDVGVIDETPYLVMELLEGEDLERYLRAHGPLTEVELGLLAAPLCAALGAAHDRGVVHRDLEPSNIFLALEANGQLAPKVLDFGISKRANEAVDSEGRALPHDGLMGSPPYLPPEALLGVHELTPRSDQYSLGVVLYQCLTGRPPFQGQTLRELLNAVARGEFAAPSQLAPGVSPATEAAILRALSRAPKERFEDVRELGARLLQVSQAQASPSSPSPRPTLAERVASGRKLTVRRRSPAFRRPRLALAAGALALIVLIVVGARLSSDRSNGAVRRAAESSSAAAAAVGRGQVRANLPHAPNDPASAATGLEAPAFAQPPVLDAAPPKL